MSTPPLTRPTRVEIDLEALRFNLHQVRHRVGPACEILAVVKADAYGHGARGVAPALAAAGADQFGVALVGEGLDLRRYGITRPVVVLGGVFPDEEQAVLAHDLQPALYDLDAARRLDAAARAAGARIACHLKIDTGMGRLGFRPERLGDVLAVLKGLPGLEVRGVISHLAMADEPEQPFTAAQTERFRAVVDRVRAAGFAPRYLHLANSAAVFSRDLAGCNLVRPGISLYGGLTGTPFEEEVPQRPVMRFLSQIAQLKEVPAGEGISYAHRFVTTRPSKLAAVPVGYADGYNRLLTNRGDVLIRGRRAPVAGTVCMDWILVDVTDIPAAAVGDRVTLLGRDGDECITAREWADKIGTITYEVFCNISKRVPRVFVGTER
ncbi:MAG: alanine racemase [Deltaproteobacteria bacterium]|nr:MAG: alanine racemase [Deltaproteobacteria bacterium]